MTYYIPKVFVRIQSSRYMSEHIAVVPPGETTEGCVVVYRPLYQDFMGCWMYEFVEIREILPETGNVDFINSKATD